MRITHRLWCLLGAAALAGCFPLLYDDRCGPEIRNTTVAGDLRDTVGVKIGSAIVLLAETRGSRESRQLRVTLLGPRYADPGPLSRHVVRVRLLGAGSVVLRDFPFQHANEHEIIWVPAEEIREGAEFEMLKRRLSASEGVLDLETDLPGMTRLRVPLPLQAATGWSQARCG